MSPGPAKRETRLVVGVGEYLVTDRADAVLATYALGSCVGVTAYDARAGVGGLLHFKLPHSGLNLEMAAARPAVFGDTGLPAFLGELFRLGATRPNLDIKLVGGAKSPAAPDSFNVGVRNLILAKRFLWMNGLLVTREKTGGSDYRTVVLEMETGRVTLKDPRGIYEL